MKVFWITNSRWREERVWTMRNEAARGHLFAAHLNWRHTMHLCFVLNDGYLWKHLSVFFHFQEFKLTNLCRTSSFILVFVRYARNSSCLLCWKCSGQFTYIFLHFSALWILILRHYRSQIYSFWLEEERVFFLSSDRLELLACCIVSYRDTFADLTFQKYFVEYDRTSCKMALNNKLRPSLFPIIWLVPRLKSSVLNSPGAGKAGLFSCFFRCKWQIGYPWS